MSGSLMLHRPVIDRLFQRLNLIYGKSWLDMWKDIDVDEAKAAWADTLGKFTNSELKQALDFCAASVKYPPNLPEFRMICDAYLTPMAPRMIARKFTQQEMADNRKRLTEIMSTLNTKRDYFGWVKSALANPEKYPDITVLKAREVAIEKGLI